MEATHSNPARSQVWRRLCATAIIAAIAALASASSARAELITYGSDLQAPANAIEPHGGVHPAYGGSWFGADTAFWNETLSDGRSAAAPAGGQIVELRVKGIGLRGPGQAPDPKALVHFQTLRPLGNGSFNIQLSSGETYWPLDGDPQQITSVVPINHCVQPGDFVAFNTWGGHEWRWSTYGGVPLQIFSSSRDTAMAWFEKDNGTHNGMDITRNPRQGRELLLQMVLATGPDATDFCPGGYAEHIYPGLKVEAPSAILRVKMGVAKVRVSCPGLTYGSCKGNLALEANVAGSPVTLGRENFNVAPATTTNLDVEIPPENIEIVQAARSLQVAAVADSHDDPQAAGKYDVPVQSKTTSREVTLTPDLFGSRTGCAAARKAETKALRALRLAKRAQKQARSSSKRKRAAKKVRVARRRALAAIETRRRACA